MTAISIIRQAASVHIISDGKGLALQGTPRPMLTSKVTVHPHLNCVAAVRGTTFHMNAFAHMLPHLGADYDEVRANIGQLLRPLWEQAQTQWIAAGVPKRQAEMSEIYVAGLSAERGPDSYLVATHGLYADVSPWTAFDLGPILMAPNDQRMSNDFTHIAQAEMTAEEVDSYAQLIVSAQMKLQARTADGVPARGSDDIGGFVQVTTVREDGISARIVHRFAD